MVVDVRINRKEKSNVTASVNRLTFIPLRTVTDGSTKGMISMGTEIQITWDMVIGLAAAIVTLSKGVDVLMRFTRPQKEMKKRMDKVERYLANDDKRLAKASLVHKTVLETLVLILDHMIDGNNIERMKATRTMLQGKIVEMSISENESEKIK